MTPRVLCVEDHADTYVMMTLLLARAGYEAVVATSARSALERAGAEDFDLYVVDNRLPDGLGLDLCGELRSLAPRTPILFYSGDASEAHREQAISCGASGFVRKPEITELVEAVRHLAPPRPLA
jgi:DNA-binding response OmpR family regulator